ncbi:MAG: hypothetical protein Q8P41_15725 [Pseudomonadota bacterium]|nr:hypothetical protein [Pseudomonadota bacterium]
MDESLAASEAVDREKALTLAALAAQAWCTRGGAQPEPGEQLVGHLMRASAWASRARAHRGLRPLSVADLVAAFEVPVADWLPGGGGFALMEDGLPTPICIELVDDAGTSALAEVEQRVILRAMDNLGTRTDAAEGYTTFRRFLVEHATAPHGDAARAVRAVGIDLSEVYEPVAAGAKLATPSGDVFYPCPRCGWPLAVRGSSLSCARSATCLAEGSWFRLEKQSVIPLGKLDSPQPRPCTGVAVLRVGVWRYTTLPGLAEIELATRLEEIAGVQVELWPFIDRYDLDVRLGEHQWRVDVKDQTSAMRLARHLAERPAREATWIVVPDARRDQVPILHRNVPPEARYLFAYSSEFVRRVKGAL